MFAYCNRILLESLGIALAVPLMTDEHVAPLEAQLATMRASPGEARWHEAHAAFHAGLVEPCSAARRADVERLMLRSERYRRLSIHGDEPAGRATGDAEHEAILDACRAREGDEAAVRLARHLARSALTLLAHLAPDADPAGVRGALQLVMSRSSSSQGTLT